MSDESDDVRLHVSGGFSDRLFWALIVMSAVFITVLLAGCAYVFKVTTSSDGNQVTGDFMIGSPHENNLVQDTSGVNGSAERFDVLPRIESGESNKLGEDRLLEGNDTF